MVSHAYIILPAFAWSLPPNIIFTSSSTKSRSSHQMRRDKHKKLALVLAGLGAAVAATYYATPHLDKNPIHTSALTGQMWVDELLTGEC